MKLLEEYGPEISYAADVTSTVANAVIRLDMDPTHHIGGDILKVLDENDSIYGKNTNFPEYYNNTNLGINVGECFANIS